MTNTEYEQRDTAAAFAELAADTKGEKALVWHALLPHLQALPKNAHVLDFGCGTGWLARRVQYELGLNASGYDPAAQMIAQAKLAAAADAIPFVTQLDDVRGTFDFIAMVFVVPAIAAQAELQQAFAQMAQRLSGPHSTIAVFVANSSAVLLRHTSYQSRALDHGLQAGMPYAVDLYHSDGRHLTTVTDTFWPHETLVACAATAGLHTVASTVAPDNTTPPGAADEVHPYRLYLFRVA